MGYACAMAMLLLAIILVINLIENLFFKEKEAKQYEKEEIMVSIRSDWIVFYSAFYNNLCCAFCVYADYVIYEINNVNDYMERY